MARTSILTGLALIVLGVVVSLASASQSVTSLIPAFIGVGFLLLGLAGRIKPAVNHHLMHAASVLALLAVLGSVGSIVGRGAGGWALLSQVVTVAIAGTFLVLAIRSFKAARRARTEAAVAG